MSVHRACSRGVRAATRAGDPSSKLEEIARWKPIEEDGLYFASFTPDPETILFVALIESGGRDAIYETLLAHRAQTERRISRYWMLRRLGREAERAVHIDCQPAPPPREDPKPPTVDEHNTPRTDAPVERADTRTVSEQQGREDSTTVTDPKVGGTDSTTGPEVAWPSRFAEPLSPAEIRRADELYGRQCAACHGAAGDLR